MNSTRQGASSSVAVLLAVLAAAASSCKEPDRYVPLVDASAMSDGMGGRPGSSVSTGGTSGASRPDDLAMGGTTGAEIPRDADVVDSVVRDDATVDLVVTDSVLQPDVGPAPPACGNGPGQTCCENDSMACTNNCGTAGIRSCRGGAYGACSIADTCCGEAACNNNCGERGTRSCSGTTWGACSAAMRSCCPGDSMSCTNNCGTVGTRSCNNGNYGACSVGNTCCGDRSCMNNCGERGTRSCNGTTLSGCSVANRACCPGQSRACSNSCGMSGTIACRNGQYNNADCTAKDSACDPCRNVNCGDNPDDPAEKLVCDRQTGNCRVPSGSACGKVQCITGRSCITNGSCFSKTTNNVIDCSRADSSDCDDSGCTLESFCN